MSDKRPLGIVQYVEARNAEAERRREAREDAISWVLTIAVVGGMLWLSRDQLREMISISPEPAVARETTQCPATEVQLNPYEYEMQRRRCEAIEAGALDRMRQQ